MQARRLAACTQRPKHCRENEYRYFRSCCPKGNCSGERARRTTSESKKRLVRMDQGCFSLLPHLGPRTSTIFYENSTDRLSVVRNSGRNPTYARSPEPLKRGSGNPRKIFLDFSHKNTTKTFSYIEAKMFEHWMMTTNFLISVAAISSLMLSIYNQLRAPVATPVARPVLQRSDATLGA